METSRQTGIVLACLLLQVFTANGNVVNQHEPVLEGTNVTLTCSGTTPSDDRYVTWRTEGVNQNSSAIANCNFSTLNCENFLKMRYNAIINISNQSFSSSMTISNVTSDDQYRMFECRVFNDNWSHPLESWNISQVFYPPDELACKARLHDNVFINVTCVTPKVYPGIQCEFVQLYNDHNLSKVASEDLVRDNTTIGDSRYNPASCSAIVRAKVPGKYLYYITIYPGLSSSDRFIKGLHYRQAHITVDGNMGVIVEKDSTISCPERDKPIRIYCKSYWMSVKPSIQWITKNVSKEVIPELIGDYYQSAINLTYSDLPEDKLVKCKVRYQNASINGSIQVDFVWPPPQTPIFSHNGKNNTGTTQIFKEGEITGTFVCTIAGGNPAVKSVTVICNVPPNKVVVNITESSIGNFVSFNLSIDQTNKQVICSCYGEHETKCYNTTTQLFVIAASEQSALPQSYKSPVVLYYIVAGTIGVLFLIVILGLAMFLNNKWRDLYTYINVHFSISETNERTATHQECEHSYEPISQIFSRFSSSRRVRAQPYHEHSSESQLVKSHTMVSSSETSCVLSIQESVYQNYANLLKEGDRTQARKIFPQFGSTKQQVVFHSKDILNIARSRMSPREAQSSDSSWSPNNQDMSCENNCNTHSLTMSSRNLSVGTQSTLSLNSCSHYTLSDSEPEYQSSYTSEEEDEGEDEEEGEEEETYFATSLPTFPPKPCSRRGDRNNGLAPGERTSSTAKLPKPHRFGRSISSPERRPKKTVQKSTMFSLTTWESQSNQQRQPRKQKRDEVGIYCNLQHDKRTKVNRDNKVKSPRKPQVHDRVITREIVLSKGARKPLKVEENSKMASLLLEKIRKPPIADGALFIASLHHDNIRKPPVPYKHLSKLNHSQTGRTRKPSVGDITQAPSTPLHENFKKPPVPHKPTNPSTLPPGRTSKLRAAEPVLGSCTSDQERFRTLPGKAGKPEAKLLTNEYMHLLPELPPRDGLHRSDNFSTSNQKDRE